MYKFILDFFLKYKYFILILLCLGIGESFLSVYVDSQIEHIVDNIQKNPEITIFFAVGAFALYKAMHHSVLFFKKVIDSIIWPQNTEYLIKNLYLKNAYYSLHWFASNMSGIISKKIEDSLIGLRYVVSYFYYIVNNIFYLTFSLIALFSIHRIVTFLEIIFLIFYLLIIYIILKKYFILQKNANKSRQEIIGIINNSFSNIFLVKIIGKIFNEFKKNILPPLKKLRDNEAQLCIFDTYVLELFNFFSITIISIIEIALLIYFFKTNVITAGQFAFGFVLVLNLKRNLLNFILDLNNNLMFYFNYVKSSEEIFSDPFQIHDSPNAYDLTNPKGIIKFENVNFIYPENERKVLKNINLEILAGQRVGIIGFSGSGKSTLIKALFRYSDVQNGSITIDGHDIKDLKQESLWDNIAIIPQETAILHRSILENLQIAKDEAAFEEIKEACIKANIHDAIMQMPEGYETIIGENGGKISGGQKQRIGIARAILKNAPILVLDEATSALDKQTEEVIYQSLDEIFMHKDITIINITHKIENLRNMDIIYMMQDGEIVESGNYDHFVEKLKKTS